MVRDANGRFVKGSGLQDLTGFKFGRLTAISLSEKRSGRKTFWDCVCECGKNKTIRTDSLKDGSVRSCGCLKKEQDRINLPNGQGVISHGLSKERIYSTWRGMLSRCEDENDKSYKSYGGRGIKACSDWHDLQNFVDWAYANEYDDSLTLERIDVNGNYEPNNCTWIPIEKQALNKRNTIRIEYKGETKTISEWSKELGISQGLIRSRFKSGMSPSDIFKKGRVSSKRDRYLTYQGRTQTVPEWAKEIGITSSALSGRVRRGLKPLKLFYGGSLNGYKDETTPR